MVWFVGVGVGEEGLAGLVEFLLPHLDERQCRLLAGATARLVVRGGITMVADVGASEGWMSLGDDHDTAAFELNAIGRWWQSVGSARYPDATRLQVSAHRGGSNGYRNRLWKRTLAALAAETGLAITVCHYPPGTSKWNKIVIYTGIGPGFRSW